jgi:hypothetical protein
MIILVKYDVPIAVSGKKIDAHKSYSLIGLIWILGLEAGREMN